MDNNTKELLKDFRETLKASRLNLEKMLKKVKSIKQAADNDKRR